jgi:hypothetical protein
MVHNILEFSGHGTMRNGYRRDDGSFKPCQFIFKLEPKRGLELFIQPIIDGKVLLRITAQKLIELSAQNPNKFEMSIWNDRYNYLTRGGDFSWHIMEAPTRTVEYREYNRKRP